MKIVFALFLMLFFLIFVFGAPLPCESEIYLIFNIAPKAMKSGRASCKCFHVISCCCCCRFAMLLMGNLHNYRGACQPRPAAPFELVKCGAFGQRHLTDARMRELCIEREHIEKDKLTDKERQRETDI